MTKGTRQEVTVGGHRLSLSNLDKVLYPETGTTKADVLAYYTEVAPYLIAAARDRPATRKRWVNGVGTPEKPGQMFFQKNLDDATPDWVPRATQVHKDHNNDYPLLNDLATLTWLAQIATLEIHVPQWRFDHKGHPQNPDRLVLDLDPGDGAGLHECVEVALLSRPLLTDMGLDAVPVTSGSKGLHLYAALDGTASSQEISDVAHELARALEADHPKLVVSTMAKALRPGKVLVDWSQNNANKTTVAPYSLRGRTQPWVAVPRTWRELATGKLTQLDYKNTLKRLKRRGDPFAAVNENAAGDGAPDSTDDAPGPAAQTELLASYRAKRDPGKTPEPMVQDSTESGAGNSFVIQEHHARALHWDFRLERDGVLVSWALPKGVPTNPGKNHLAVQTEDHPLDYGSFAGTIPRGQYGAGEVTIWDSGFYELEKWRDGKEIIATLTGRPDGGLGGPRRLALIHTKGDSGAKSQWLIHVMKEQSEEGHNGRSGARGPALEGPYSPMLAATGSVEQLKDPEQWALEMKWDGVRAIATVEGDTVKLTSRNGKDLTARFPELVQAIALSVPADSAILDGEIVALNPSGRPDFGLLQKRLKLLKPAEIIRAAEHMPTHYMAFDVLEIGGASAVDREFSQRRGLLEELLSGLPAAGKNAVGAKATRQLASSASVQLSPIMTGSLQHAMELSRKTGLEGVVAKRHDSAYRSGRRTENWVKFKHVRTQEVVVGGWRDGKGNRRGTIGSLLVGIPDGNGKLVYAGRVGSGFSDVELAELARSLQGLSRKTPPFADVPAADSHDAHWVTAKLVGEVSFAEWTGAGRLRQPVWRGWRLDKDPAEVRREDGPANKERP
ncbi:ATP-dependent DNA ligase [Arthrobacter livingstonensis]|uniref:DNA ligase (ATP) n=1 Tax=Arthrobacter livingstonensis TaxID=670078 RepID=A0A2V5L6W9_9MICC|nr:ATP-dependent DNA ligase [Arthrobacter livingstonensis]PYI66422.1 ATP-dependent DNA ligase [Arthrobacter livingstonensis]